MTSLRDVVARSAAYSGIGRDPQLRKVFRRLARSEFRVWRAMLAQGRQTEAEAAAWRCRAARALRFETE